MWSTVAKKQAPVKKQQSTKKTQKTNGEDIVFPTKYVLWCHDIQCKDWSLNGYIKLCTISNVSEFWKLFNNLDKVGYRFNNIFFMKEGIDPTWEHEKNRNGGICSMKSDIYESLDIYEELCCYLICGTLTDKPDDINGISFCPKNNWGIVKIWNADKKNDLSKVLHKDLLEKYKEYSIKYSENHPEF